MQACEVSNPKKRKSQIPNLNDKKDLVRNKSPLVEVRSCDLSSQSSFFNNYNYPFDFISFLFKVVNLYKGRANPTNLT
jgi:hypothetical protein